MNVKAGFLLLVAAASAGCAPADRATPVAENASSQTSAVGGGGARSSASASLAAAASPCPTGALQLVSEDPARPGATELLRLHSGGDIELAIRPGKSTFALDPAGCLLFQGKLVAELNPDGHIVSAAGEPLGSLAGSTLTLRHSKLEIADDGAVVQTPSPGLPPWRFVGLTPSTRCAAAMLLIALGESMSGASMAVNDGGAKRPAAIPAAPSARCAHVPR